MTQGKYWLITDYNTNINYDTEPAAFWTSKRVVYSKGQLELCPTTERLHWQFTVCFDKKVRPSTVKTLLGNQCHNELTNSEETLNYVWKDETSQGRRWEWGTLPFKRNRSADWEQVWDLAKKGKFEDIPANIRVNSYNSLKKIAMDNMKPEGIEKDVKVYWGPTGVGKSRKAWDEAGWDAYPKAPTTKFWDGYQGQENVVMDEFFGQIEVRF